MTKGTVAVDGQLVEACGDDLSPWVVAKAASTGPAIPVSLQTHGNTITRVAGHAPPFEMTNACLFPVSAWVKAAKQSTA